MKQLDMTLVSVVNENAALAQEEYSYVRENERRDARSKAKRRKRIENIMLCLVLIVMIILGVFKIINAEPRYAKASESENHYVYVTERVCKVTEITEDYVTVEYDGKEYDFFGYGYEVGEEIICQFTDGWEIVGVCE